MAWAIEEKCYSQRRACGLIGLDPKTYRYASRRPDDAAVRTRLKELALERRRFGYRRLFVLLRREGEPSGINRIHRLYREEGLCVRKRRARRGGLADLNSQARSVEWVFASFMPRRGAACC